MALEEQGTAFKGLRWLKATRGMVESRLLGRHRPIWVNIEPTHRCNLACDYCDKAGDGGPEMTEAQLVGLIDELAAAGTLSVCFDGGEPLVHRGLPRALERAKAHGMRTSLSTNGILIPRREAAMRFVDVVKVSIDGPAEIHDAARGAGSYAKAIVGVRHALKSGISAAIRMTLARHNVHAYRHVLELAAELGVTALFQPAIGSLMDAAARPDEQSPDPKAYRQAMEALHRAKAGGAPVGNEYVCIEHLAQFPEPVPVSFCAGGRVEIAIGPDGGMFPCGRVGRGPSAPNVFELGVAAAFEQVLRPKDCASCWCTLTLGNCYAYDLSPRLLEGRLVSPPLFEAPITPARSSVEPPARLRLPLVANES
jgi:MoaA/NifB/PqqE/SkfB family radical SAM enzyme